MPQATCPSCGRHFAPAFAGRAKRYCSTTCRVRAFRLRQYEQSRAVKAECQAILRSAESILKSLDRRA